MAGLQILFFSSCIMLVSVCSIRGQIDKPMSGYMCAMNCTFRHANAWASVLSLNNPSTNLMNWIQGIAPTLPPGVSATNDSLSKVCDVYDSYNNCLDKCPDDVFRANVKSTINGIQMICTSQRKEVTSNTMPCVNQFTTMIRETCRAENEKLMSSTNQLQSIESRTPAMNFIGLMQRLCESVLAQSQCVLPQLKAKCGYSASDLMNQLMTASLGSVEKIIGDKRDQMPVQCRELFNIIVKHDNGTISVQLPEVTTTTTPAAPTQQITNADLKSGDNGAGQSTAASKGSIISSFSTMLLVVIFIFTGLYI